MTSRKPATPMRPLTTQEKFDSVMLLVTETVSSTDYLNHLDIYRPDPLGKTKWDTLTKNVQNQTKKSVKTGIYPRSYDASSVHYYAIRQEPSGVFTAANGYPNAGGFGSTYGVGLNAQPNHSHGLCQTFALMYYFREEYYLVPGSYMENVIIGLQWLKKFTVENPWVFEYNKMVDTVHINEKQKSQQTPENMTFKDLLGDKYKPQLFVEKGKKYIALHVLVDWLLEPMNRPLLETWAADLNKPNQVQSPN
jgi:hypothetical protein